VVIIIEPRFIFMPYRPRYAAQRIRVLRGIQNDKSEPSSTKMKQNEVKETKKKVAS